MANTPILALPYPAPADTVDVPRDIQALATKLDGVVPIVPALVAALPGAPVDGQEVYYQNAAMAAAGVIWNLRYRAGSANANKWEMIGGNALRAETAANETRGPAADTTTWLAMSTPASVVVPLSGVYEVEYGAHVVTGNASAIVSPTLQVADTAALQTPLALLSALATLPATANQYAAMSQVSSLGVALIAGRTIAETFVLSSTVATITLSRKRVALRPIRVG